MLPQVSSRSRKSLEEMTGASAYGGVGGAGTGDGRNHKNGNGSGLGSSPSVISLHDPTKNGGGNGGGLHGKQRLSKDSNGLPREGLGDQGDMYADEVA